MHRILHGSLVVLVAAAAACPLMGQNSPTPVKPTCCRTQHPEAYTATFKITNVQVLADGTTITRESTEIEARDSQGRRLRSTTEETPNPGLLPGTMAHATDPVAETQTTWNSRTKKATVTKLPAQEEREGCWASADGMQRMSWFQGPRLGKPAPNGTVMPDGSTIVPAPRHKPEVEDLGTSSIQGFEVHGHRFTSTIPEGEAGNDKPIVTVNESWTSTQLGLSLRESYDDPRNGKRTRELVSLTLGDPDLSLFQPPDGYEVTTEELHKIECPPPR